MKPLARRFPAPAILATLLLAAAPMAAWAQSAVQITPDGKRVLVNKDLGGQRWAISLDEGDGTVTGNVFSPGGGDPQFVWCETIAEKATDLSFRCAGADRCPLAPCGVEEWAGLGEVTLPRSFFAPPEAEAAVRSAGRALGGSAGSPSGSQDTPDQRRVLISKDVGGERWAISLNFDDRTVTGNVFRPGGGEPLFVWCEEKSSAEDEVTYSCRGADRCEASPCAPETEWSFIADVTLPSSFFMTPRDVDPDDVADAVVRAHGDEAGAAALLLALDKGYSLRQVVRASLTDRLRGNGDIDSRAGGIEPPAGPPLGLFSTASASADRVAGGDLDALDVVTALSGPREADLRVTALIMLLLRQGYDATQITEVALGLGRVDLADCDDFEKTFHEDVCQAGFRGVLIRDSEGRIVPPNARTAAEIFRRDHSTELPCGDGIVGPDEDCEGLNLRGRRCADLGRTGGTLACTDQCKFDLSGCSSCNNGIVEPGEECEAGDLRGETCRSRGFPGGELGCTDKCLFDASQCSVCGNGIVEDGENCEPTNLEGVQCTDLGFLGGELRCRIGCLEFDTSRCNACGNNRIDDEHEEVCDGSDLGDLTCETFGLFGDGLRCDANCFPDASGCLEEPVPTPSPTPEPCSGELCPDGTCVPAGADCCGGGRYCAPGTVCAGDGCCPPGLTETCGNTLCTEPGSDCCPTGGACDPGLVCADDGVSCCPAGFPQVCGDLCITAGALCCGSEVCVSGSCCGSACMPPGGDCCGSGAFCSPGYVCVGGGECCPGDFPQRCPGSCAPADAQCCGSGYCPAGQSCVDGGCVVSVGSVTRPSRREAVQALGSGGTAGEDPS